jgi:uncharacterized protein GlcG (DUF336 family)
LRSASRSRGTDPVSVLVRRRPLADAERAIAAGKAKAAELGGAFNIVVLDAGAHLAAAVQPGGPLFSIEAATRAPLAFVPGDFPVTDQQGRVIGAVGAGGGTPDQDHEVAAAARAAL